METLSLKELLRITIPDSNRFENYWAGTSKTSFSLSKVCGRHYLYSICALPEKTDKKLTQKPNEKNDKYDIKLLYSTAFIPRFA